MRDGAEKIRLAGAVMNFVQAVAGSGVWSSRLSSIGLIARSGLVDRVIGLRLLPDDAGRAVTVSRDCA
jgi:hypothetical protein